MSKRTIIGVIVGSVIIGIGLYALVTSFGIQQVKGTEIFETAKIEGIPNNMARAVKGIAA